MSETVKNGTVKNGLEVYEIQDKIPLLTNGNWYYWVRFKARLDPIDNYLKGRHLVDLYPFDSVERIREVLRSAGRIK